LKEAAEAMADWRFVYAFLLAPLGRMLVFAIAILIGIIAALIDGPQMAYSPPTTPWTRLLVVPFVGGYALLGGVIFVLPALMFFPKLRQPSIPFAAAWGALAAVGFAHR
jgi:hypothetical protein